MYIFNRFEVIGQANIILFYWMQKNANALGLSKRFISQDCFCAIVKSWIFYNTVCYYGFYKLINYLWIFSINFYVKLLTVTSWIIHIDITEDCLQIRILFIIRWRILRISFPSITQVSTINRAVKPVVGKQHQW